MAGLIENATALDPGTKAAEGIPHPSVFGSEKPVMELPPVSVVAAASPEQSRQGPSTQPLVSPAGSIAELYRLAAARLAAAGQLPPPPGQGQIRGASLEAVVAQFGKLTQAADKSDPRLGTVRYLGVLKRPEFEQQVEAVVHAIPPGSEPELRAGGQRWWYFDLAQHLPVLVVTKDDSGKEIDYCRCDCLNARSTSVQSTANTSDASRRH
jgi:hypothetical protein